jgi:1-acyl-sn-glycerol-3-phosphate acyltransferase
MSLFYYHLTHHLAATIPRLASRIYRDGFDLVPKSGAALLLSNHISHFDPPLMGLSFPRILHFMADKPLLEIPIYGPMLRRAYVFPIDRTKNDRAALRTAMDRLKGGNVVVIFPEKGIRHGKNSVLGGAELAIGTASLWKMMDVPVIPMVIIGSDQLYAWKNYFRRPRIFIHVGAPLPPDKGASREDLRDRIANAWLQLFAETVRKYQIRPDELPQSAQERWGRPPPKEPEAPAAPDEA